MNTGAVSDVGHVEDLVACLRLDDVDYSGKLHLARATEFASSTGSVLGPTSKYIGNHAQSSAQSILDLTRKLAQFGALAAAGFPCL